MAKGKYKEWLTSEGLILIEGWARDGLIDTQIAHNMGIAPATLYVWQKKYKEISETLKNGKEIIDRKVENALLKKIMGYDYDEITEQEQIDADGIRRLKKIVTKHVDGDTAATIFWLKNRKPDKWRDKQEVESTEALDKLDAILNEVKSDATK